MQRCAFRRGQDRTLAMHVVIVDFVRPRAVEERTLTPEHTGKFAVLCDICCGEDRERMTAYSIVTERGRVTIC